MDKKFKHTIKLLNKRIITNTKISENTENKNLLHISLIRQKSLIPNISKRAADSEDNTLPRIHTSNSLLGCIIGYSNVPGDVMYKIPGYDKSGYSNNGKGVLYKGGYYIHSIPYKYSLVPNKKLVFDTEASGEQWLITYDEKTKEYPCDIIGKLIPLNIKISTAYDETSETTYELALSLNNEIQVNDKDILNPGYYILEVSDRKAMILNTKIITKKEFTELKSLKASILSYLGW